MKQSEPSPFLGRLIEWSLDYPLSAFARYVAATLMVAVVALLRATLVTDLLPWLLFTPVVLLSGLLLGKGTGLYAVALSAFLAGLTIASARAPWLSGPQWFATAVFIVIGTWVVLLASDLRAAFRRARLLMAERETSNAQLVGEIERRELLQHELGHRMKNLLAVIQAVVQQSLRKAPDLASASEVIGFRLAALGQATDLLTASEWSAADLHEVAKAALRVHDTADRIRVEGPALCFNPQVCLALALTFHELATNATKYGALSNDAGQVDLCWSVTSGAGEEAPRFQLTWRESGGPAVEQPSRRGFGSLMIERSLRSYFRGETSIEYRPDGLVFRIDAPLTEAQVESEQAWQRQ